MKFTSSRSSIRGTRRSTHAAHIVGMADIDELFDLCSLASIKKASRRSADLSIASRPSLRADLIMKNNNESIRAWAKRCHLTIHSSLVTFAPAARLKEFQPSGPPARSRVVTEYYSYDNKQLITKRKCGLSAIAPKFL